MKKLLCSALFVVGFSASSAVTEVNAPSNQHLLASQKIDETELPQQPVLLNVIMLPNGETENQRGLLLLSNEESELDYVS